MEGNPDGAGQYAPAFDAVFEAEQIRKITIPPGAPKANADAERWVRTLRHELLDRTIIWNERRLRTLIGEYFDHCNRHRPHRTLGQNAPTGKQATAADLTRPVRRHARCGRLINEYRPAT